MQTRSSVRKQPHPLSGPVPKKTKLSVLRTNLNATGHNAAEDPAEETLPNDDDDMGPFDDPAWSVNVLIYWKGNHWNDHKAQSALEEM